MSSLVCSFDLSDLYSFEEFMAHQDDHGWDIDENNPERSWESYLESESEYLFEDFCDCLGQRILAKDKKVLIEGSNLNWQGASGVATFRAWGDDTLVENLFMNFYQVMAIFVLIYMMKKMGIFI
jgi:hypothetical protein